MQFEIIPVTDDVLRKTSLPYFTLKPQFRFGAKRKPALDVLQGTLNRDRLGEGQKHMKVVWHQDEFVKKVFPVSPVIQEDLAEEFRHSLGAKERAAFPCGRGGKESSVRRR